MVMADMESWGVSEAAELGFIGVDAGRAGGDWQDAGIRYFPGTTGLICRSENQKLQSRGIFVYFDCGGDHFLSVSEPTP
jgi:hypothetical protein